MKSLPPAPVRRPTRIKLPLDVKHIPHKLPTRKNKDGWYMTRSSGPSVFIFENARTKQRVTKTAADGWSYDDAYTFHQFLMGWA